MQKPAFIAKTTIFIAALFAESFLLTQLLITFSQSGDYFTPSIETLGMISGAMLLIIYTYTLTVGAWDTWTQYLLVPAPISLGILISVLQVNQTYAVIAGLISFLVISYEILLAVRMRDLLIKFNPRLVFRYSTKFLLMIFSILGALIVFLHLSESKNAFNITDKITEIIGGQVTRFTNPTLNEEEIEKNLLNELGGKPLPYNPEMFGQLGGLQLDSNAIISGLTTLNLDLEDTIRSEVENIISPYKHFIPPLISIIVFALFQFLATLVNFVFGLTINPLFGILKRMGLYKVTLETTEREIISF